MDEPIGIDAMTIVKFCILLIIGLVILSSIANTNSASSARGASITITQQPNDGDTVQLDEHIYEFDNDGHVGVNHISVAIGTTLDATISNFKVAISTNYAVA